MADVIVLHHALGLTPGVVAFADHLEQAGLPWHDAEASAVLLDRVTTFLDRIG